MRLSDVIGQDRATTLLRRVVAGGRLAHASLFDGPEGVGKRGAALGLGLALCCPEAPGTGCGVCDTCRRILAGQHPDVRVFMPTTSQYHIDQVREIAALAMGRPHEAPARVLILDQADCLNSSSANGLLKTLEEPFPGNHLVLVTSAPDRLLSTIRSRTQRVRFVALGLEALVEIAVRRGASRSVAQTAAALAGGQVARLLQIVESESESDLWTAVGTLRQAASAKGVGAIFDAAGAYSDKESRQDLPAALSLLARLYRDALVTAAGAADLAILQDKSIEVESLAERARTSYDLLPLRRALRAVLEATLALASNVNPVTALEKMMMDLRTSLEGAR